MIIGKIFNKYDVNFPMDDNLVIIVGANGTGKTKTLELTRDYFTKQGENVLYFPTDRRLTINKDDVEKVSVMNHLAGKDDVWDIICNSYEMHDPFFWEYHKTGEWISGGMPQVINFFYNILLDPRKDLIVMIDNIERSLHIMVLRKILRDIISLSKVKKLIVVTYSPEVISDEWDHTYEIEQICNINR